MILNICLYRCWFSWCKNETYQKAAPRITVFQIPTHFNLKDFVQQKGRVDMPRSFFWFRHIGNIRQHLSSLHNPPAATSHRLRSIQPIGGSAGITGSMGTKRWSAKCKRDPGCDGYIRNGARRTGQMHCFLSTSTPPPPQLTPLLTC